MENPATPNHQTVTLNQKSPSKNIGSVLLPIFSIITLISASVYAYMHFFAKPANISEITTGTTVPCNQGVNNGCGAAPNPLPQYNKTSSLTITQNGEFIVYYNGSSGATANFTVNGNAQNVPLISGRITTGINLKTGDNLVLSGVTEQNQGNQPCSEEDPYPNPKYKGTGWIPLNTDSTCGSGLTGPPTGGVCKAFAKIDMSGFISQAESNDEILSKQCWADWREWPGDYDFNDYFIMLAIEPEPIPPQISCNSLSSDVVQPKLNDTITYTCAGSVNSGGEITYEFRYRLDGGEYIPLSSVGNAATLITESEGDWNIECRACTTINDTQLCSNSWQGAQQ